MAASGDSAAMRIPLAFAVLVALAAPVLAADWMSYANARFGYSIDVPPGFVGQAEATNGDGQVFRDEAGTQVLTVWGGNVIEDDFESEAARLLTSLEGEGWNITYKASAPDWASFSGTSGDQVIYLRSIALCGGSHLASFQFEYFVADLAALDPVVNRLVRSFRAGRDC
jgi:hypothetical protein